MNAAPSEEQILHDVRNALREDLGDGDATAALIPEERRGQAELLSRQDAVLCGKDWFHACFRELDPNVSLRWSCDDGDRIHAGQTLCHIQGQARALLSAERAALNFLQTLSGTATTVAEHVAMIQGSSLQILDTRKTLPGLRVAQKYAVRCGGGHNHRMGLYDACLIKENHIQAGGGITATLRQARESGLPVEIEVENLEQLREALDAGAEWIMLDNFPEETMREAVEMNQGRAKLEVSGNVEPQDLPALAALGVDCVSVGALTKHVRAVDFSLRF